MASGGIPRLLLAAAAVRSCTDCQSKSSRAIQVTLVVVFAVKLQGLCHTLLLVCMYCTIVSQLVPRDAPGLYFVRNHMRGRRWVLSDGVLSPRSRIL